MNRFVLINMVLFQAVWFACVMGGARDIWWWGALGVAALMACSAWRDTLNRDLRLAAVLGPCGFVLDSVWATTGVLQFGSAAAVIDPLESAPAFAPIWIIFLWIGVAFTLLHSLRWLARKPWFGALLAGGAAIPCYLGGERLGAVVIPNALALGFIAAAWFCVFFLLFRWAQPQVMEDSPFRWTWG